jgi:ATP-binding cassette subfamily F protein 3
MAPVKAYRPIYHDRLALQLDEGHCIAERKSGALGKQARKELIRLEERLEKSREQLVESCDISSS